MTKEERPKNEREEYSSHVLNEIDKRMQEIEEKELQDPSGTGRRFSHKAFRSILGDEYKRRMEDYRIKHQDKCEHKYAYKLERKITGICSECGNIISKKSEDLVGI